MFLPSWYDNGMEGFNMNAPMAQNEKKEQSAEEIISSLLSCNTDFLEKKVEELSTDELAGIASVIQMRLSDPSINFRDEDRLSRAYNAACARLMEETEQ